MSIPSMEELLGKAIDVAEVREMEIEVDYERRVVYINVEGITLLRCSLPEKLRYTTKSKFAPGHQTKQLLWGDPP